MTFEIGRVCVKLAGRDAGMHCVVVEKLEGRFVTIDGNTRRRKCNVAHLVPTKDLVEITEKASTGEVKEKLSSLGIDVIPVTKPKKVAERQKTKRVLASKDKK